MELYNKIMTKLWLVIAIVVFAVTSYMCITDDYRQWIYYYVIVAIALVMYFMKRWMVKRMARHLDYLEDQANKH